MRKKLWADDINEEVLNLLEGETTTYLSFDSIELRQMRTETITQWSSSIN